MDHSPTESPLGDRAQHLFKALVDRYIRDGRPVGSRTLSRDSGLELSPATIRNVMADLEELGLLRAPHTSAGRVPTVRGYRLFIDSLMRVSPLDRAELHLLETQLSPSQDHETLMGVASSLLSDITHLAGVVMIPKHEQITLRQVEFLSLSDRQVLVILVINEREVQNRIIRTDRDYTASELQQAANYLNGICAGEGLDGVRQRLLDELDEHRERMNRMMLAAIEMANKAFSTTVDGDELVVAGQTNLMEYGDLADMERLRHLFEAFAHKRDILHLLDSCLQAEGVQIFIGEESGYDVLEDCSLVTAPYVKDGEVFGALGVIGPTRMAYDRVIPIVDMTARVLGAALNQQR